MPSPAPIDAKDESPRAPSETIRALAKQLITPPQGDAVVDRIAGILQGVPEGILRAFCRHGVTICVADDDPRFYDPRTRRVPAAENLYRQGVAVGLKTALGWAFNHLLLADYVEQQGGKRESVCWRLSDVAERRHGLRDADRLVDCWQNGDTLSEYATRGIGPMFAEGFAAFCTPTKREEFRLRAPGLFELISEFADRYEKEPLQPKAVQELPSDATGLDRAREYAGKMLVGSRSVEQREEVAQFLRSAPPELLELLVSHGVRICIELGKGPSTYSRIKRRVTLKWMDRGTLLHELGHALDHVACIEAVKHDIGLPPRSDLSYLTELGLNFPGRYGLADALAARWHKGQKVSAYAQTDIFEWFAESFKCSRDAGAAYYIRSYNWRHGDGTRATLTNRDPKFIPLLHDIMQRLQHGMDITAMREIEPPCEPSVRYTKGQNVRGSELRDARAVRSLQVKLVTAVIAALVLVAGFPVSGWLIAGAIGISVGMAVALAASSFYAVTFRREYFRRLGDLPPEHPTVLGRRGADFIVAQRANGTIVHVDRHLFSSLVDPPKLGETIALGEHEGTLYALTERQTRPQAKGTWLPRAAAPSEKTTIIDLALAKIAITIAREAAASNLAFHEGLGNEPSSSTGRRAPQRIVTQPDVIESPTGHKAPRRPSQEHLL